MKCLRDDSLDRLFYVGSLRPPQRGLSQVPGVEPSVGMGDMEGCVCVCAWVGFPVYLCLPAAVGVGTLVAACAHTRHCECARAPTANPLS